MSGLAAARAAIVQHIGWLDALIGAQLDAVLHHPRFQDLEARWRGLAYLAGHAHRHQAVVLRLLALTKDELAKDIGGVLEIDQTNLFHLVYAEEFGMPGGLPYGLLLADFPVAHRQTPGRSISDIDLLAGLATISAAAFAPVLVPAAPDLLGLDCFSALTATLDVEAILGDGDRRRWRAFRQSEEARFVGVVLPRVLMRPPHGDDGAMGHGFCYRERLARGHADYLWGSGLYAFAARAVAVFARHGWLADLCGLGEPDDRRGLIDDLPAVPFGRGGGRAKATDPGVGGGLDRCGLERRAIEICLSEDLAHRLAGCGFITLQPCSYTPWVAIVDCPSLRWAAPQGHAARADDRIAALLPQMLSLCRFAHYIKVIARDRIGSFTDAGHFESLITGWLQSYCIGNADATPAQKARYPLHDAHVRVSESPGRPGALACVIHLKPHAQIQQSLVGFDLYTELEMHAGRVAGRI